MKKIAAILMALTMVFAIAACGNDIPTKADPEAKTTEAPAVTTAEQPAESTPAATVPAPTAPEVSTPAASEPVETTAEETKAPETEPAETKAPETAPPETKAPETTPEETVPEETTPEETTPEETTPEETTPEETTPEETVPEETEVHADRAAYYETYLGSEDMKLYGNVLRITALVNGKLQTAMTYGPTAIIIEGEGGSIELYKQEEKLLGHVNLKPQDGSEAEDHWMICDAKEGEDPFEEIGGPSGDDLMESFEDGSTTLTYLYSFVKNGVEYDYLLMKQTMDDEDPGDEQASNLDAYMTVRADTHEIVCIEAEMVDEYDHPGDVMNEKVEALDESAVTIPAGIEPEAMEYEEMIMTIFMSMMGIMGDLF